MKYSQWQIDPWQRGYDHAAPMRRQLLDRIDEQIDADFAEQMRNFWWPLTIIVVLAGFTIGYVYWWFL